MATSDPGTYSTKIYKYPARKIIERLFPLVMILVLSFLFICNIWILKTTSSKLIPEAVIFFLFYIIFVGVIFLLYFSYAFRSRLLLSETCIELRAPGKNARLPWDHVAGVRRWTARNGVVGWEFVPTDPALRPLRVPAAFKTDRDFARWVREFPDLTRAAPEDALAKGLAAKLPRHEPEELRRLISEQVIGAHLLTITAIGLSILFLFQVGTVWLAALLFALPWIAGIFVAASRGVMTLVFTKSDPRPSAGVAMTVPALILVVGPPYHAHLLAPLVVLVGAPLIGTILLALALLADRSLLKARYSLLSYFLIFSAFTAASTVAFNVELDGSPGDVFLTTALSKQGFSLEHPDYQITLAPWGAVSDRQPVKVSREFFGDTLIGRQLCVSLHPGAFGLSWYTIFHCQSEGSQFTPGVFEGG